MAAVLNYPGVYIQELESPVHTIAGVGTSITAFVGRAARGPLDTAVLIHNFGDFTQAFGGLWADSAMSFSVQQYFINGGADAVIVRVASGAAPATIELPTGGGTLTLAAANPGLWGMLLSASVDANTSNPSDATLYNLTVKDTRVGGVTETIRNLSRTAGNPREITKVLLNDSKLVSVQGGAAGGPLVTAAPVMATAGSASDGNLISDAQIIGSTTAPKTGIYALDDTDLFNLLCIPPFHYDDSNAAAADPSVGTLTSALAYCAGRRAMLIVDPPIGWADKDAPNNSTKGLDGSGVSAFKVPRSENAVLYFPRIVAPNPQRNNQLTAFAPCGFVAGVIARTDASRGVWKAPAGIDATLLGALDFSVHLTDAENGELNPVAVNCLRSFKGIGQVVWGARTLRGADRLADQWKYLPVRRLALYIEESLYRGTQWVVFEPNDEPLWAQIRLNIGSFMTVLFRQGAFQGSSPRDAFLVKCDKETTTQDDIDRGVVNILVGFAPLKPAEFVVIQIQQLAGQTQGG